MCQFLKVLAKNDIDSNGMISRDEFKKAMTEVRNGCRNDKLSYNLMNCKNVVLSETFLDRKGKGGQLQYTQEMAMKMVMRKFYK